jgi:enamine deaminase RidA (YjgF/YER057c/UK114 family)
MRAPIIQACENILAGLKVAGATRENIVKSTTFVTDMKEYLKHPDLCAKYLGHPIAASTTIEVKGLVRPEFVIENVALAMV